MAKNLFSDLILACLAEIWAPKILDIIAIIITIIIFNFKENAWLKLKKIGKNLVLGLIYACWAEIRAVIFSF